LSGRPVIGRCAGTAPADVDLCVQRGHRPNAYAAGGRSVAVTAGAVEHLLARRLSEDEIVAVLVHELGHHATRTPRAALVTTWLTAPWRLATRLVLQMARTLAGQ
jgi:STE24 endopeptidase